MRIMDLLRKVTGFRPQTTDERDIASEAVRLIRIDDFSGRLYIAFRDIPLVPVDDSWSQEEILSRLEGVRKTYIDYESRELRSLRESAAMML